jgi:hypothetical protein
MVALFYTERGLVRRSERGVGGDCMAEFNRKRKKDKWERMRERERERKRGIDLRLRTERDKWETALESMSLLERCHQCS